MFRPKLEVADAVMMAGPDEAGARILYSVLRGAAGKI
jgi:hypothetical protein